MAIVLKLKLESSRHCVTGGSSGRYSPRSIAWKATPDVCHILSSMQVQAQCSKPGSLANNCHSIAACRELVSFLAGWHVTPLRQFLRLLLGPSLSAGSDRLFGALSIELTSLQGEATNGGSLSGLRRAHRPSVQCHPRDQASYENQVPFDFVATCLELAAALKTSLLHRIQTSLQDTAADVRSRTRRRQTLSEPASSQLGLITTTPSLPKGSGPAGPAERRNGPRAFATARALARFSLPTLSRLCFRTSSCTVARSSTSSKTRPRCHCLRTVKPPQPGPESLPAGVCWPSGNPNAKL